MKTKTNQLPYITDAQDLHAGFESLNPLLLDLGTNEQYNQGHIPGAIQVDVKLLRREQPPAPGLLPELDELYALFNNLGVGEQRNVVCYDHENGASAARMLWTLELLGHRSMTMLNGGMTAWVASGYAIQTTANQAEAIERDFDFNPEVLADRDAVLAAMADPKIIILDARSAEEYRGEKSPSIRKGHIPGAINLNWLDTIDQDNHRKIKPVDALHRLLDDRGVAKDRQIIVHCQTHMRSSHTFVVLRSLGFERVSGYAGSWSQWAADPSLPIQIGSIDS